MPLGRNESYLQITRALNGTAEPTCWNIQKSASFCDQSYKPIHSLPISLPVFNGLVRSLIVIEGFFSFSISPPRQRFRSLAFARNKGFKDENYSKGKQIGMDLALFS